MKRLQLGLYLPRIQSHPIIDEPVASGIQLSKSNTLLNYYYYELNMISTSFNVIVSRLFNYLHHWMVAVGMFCLIHTAISI